MTLFKYFLSFIYVLVSCVPAYAQLTPVQEQTLGKNYAENGGFENGVAKWKRYKDTPPAAPNEELPVDGTGGTPTVTLTASTTTPIQGKASGLISKPASNVQGEGYALPFVLDKAAKGKIITISGSYEIASGTYSGGSATTDSDLEVYVYDVDAAQIIQPAGFKLDGGVAGNIYDFNATFQSNLTSSNYRLLIHHATTSTQAFTLKLEIAKIGVQNKSQGPPVIEWQTYTPTWASTGTQPTLGNGSISGKWRRVGDQMEVEIYLIVGSTSSAGTGNYYFNMPGGYSIDTTKMAGGSSAQRYNLGRASVHDTGTAIYMATTAYRDTTTVYAVVGGSGGTYVDQGSSRIVGATVPAAPANGDEIFISFTVPIVGWGSTVTMSDSADTRVVAFQASSNSTQSVASSTAVQITGWTPSVDTHGGWSAGGQQYTVQVPGLYRVKFNILTASSTIVGTTGGMHCRVILNGSNSLNDISTTGPATDTRRSCSVTGILSLRASDVVSFTLFQDTGTTLPLAGLGMNASIERISGPSQIAASESVSARYKTGAGQSIPNATGAIVDFGTKDWDSHNAVTTGGSWRFTAPVSGEYQVTSAARMANASFTLYFALYLRLEKNGSLAQVFGQSIQPTTGTHDNFAVYGSTTVKLLAGEYISVRLLHQESTARSMFANDILNFVEIRRVGNY